MKQYQLLAVSFTIIFGCNLSTEPTPRPSNSIKNSKDNKLFLNEYRPESSFLRIEGKVYKIKEAWVEHRHLERNFDIIPLSGYDFRINFEHNPHDSLNFKAYTKDLTLGNWTIWFFLNDKAFNNDTLELYYKENLNANEQKKFLLFKMK